MSNMQINWEIGKKYKRRNGVISKMTGYYDSHFLGLESIRFEDGYPVWKADGKRSTPIESPEDIIEEVKENEMKIEVGKWYKTSKDNYKAFITTHLDKSAACSMPYLGYVTTNDGIFWNQACFDENGKCNHTTFHLIEEWKEPKSGVKYFNIYQDNSGHIWEGGLSDLETVKRWAEEQTRTKTHDTLLARVRVEWKEGQFDD